MPSGSPSPSPPGPGRIRWRWAAPVGLRARILAGFLAVGLIAGAIGSVGVRNVSLTYQIAARAYDNAVIATSSARAARADFEALEALLVRAGSAAELRSPTHAERFAALVDQLEGNLGLARDRAQSAEARSAVDSALALFERWRDAAGQTGDGAHVAALSAEMREAIDVVVNHVAGDAVAAERAARDQVSAIRDTGIAATALGLTLAGMVAWLVGRRIIGPVAAASAAARGIAEGRLDTPVPEAGRDELGALLRAIAAMRDSIRAMMEREVAAQRSPQGRLVDAIESSTEGVVLVDGEGRIVIANRQVAAFFPAAAALVAPGTSAQALAWIAKLDLAAEEAELALADGRWLRVSRSPMHDGGFILVLTDITALKQQQAALEETNRRFDAALNNMSQGLCLYDVEHRLLFANRRFYEIYRLDPAVVRPGITFPDLLARSIAAGNHSAAVARTLIAERLGFVARREAGTSFQELADGRVIAISHEPIPGGDWVVTYEDITERRRAEAQITYLARHDALTGLANRLQLRERVDLAMAQRAQGTRVALLSLDLDGFRAVNEAVGQPAGDQVLRQVAERLLACVRDGDTVARLGGDEFAVLQVGIDTGEAASAMARRLLAALAKPFVVEGQVVELGASIGIALAPEDGSSHDQLLHHAQLALDQSRRERRGAVRFFTPEMDAAAQRRRVLEADLKHALERGEFEPAYQPIVEIASGRVIAFEALLRWRHPVRGMVSPLEFIPVAEELGLIVPIGAWMLRRACADAAAWPDGIRVAVNVSAVQFRDPDLVATVASALTDSGLSASRLEIEITESLLLEEEAATQATLHRLRGLGARIAMDDFGTGYSSLGYLRRFPFDKIKIDQSFIRDLDAKPDSQAIVRAITALGKSLGMRTTAEGVETGAILEMLRLEGCTEAQGYLFSRPCAAAQIPEVLRRLAQRRIPANAAAA
jgi:diguanylate cyclase (GGDEF)-like protein